VERVIVADRAAVSSLIQEMRIVQRRVHGVRSGSLDKTDLSFSFGLVVELLSLQKLAALVFIGLYQFVVLASQGLLF
jgi:hypothetical protein